MNGRAWPAADDDAMRLEYAAHAGTIPEVRRRGVRWVIPESVLSRLVEGRRRWTDDDI